MSSLSWIIGECLLRTWYHQYNQYSKPEQCKPTISDIDHLNPGSTLIIIVFVTRKEDFLQAVSKCFFYLVI